MFFGCPEHCNAEGTRTGILGAGWVYTCEQL